MTDAAHALLAPLQRHPERSAVLCDIDGTLAPIVDRATDAAVPVAAQRALRHLAGRYSLVGCVTGRAAAEARSMVGLGGLAYIGNHGLERIMPGAPRPRLDDRVSEHADAAMGFARRWDQPRLRQLRLRIEDKGPIAAFHWRGAPDEPAAIACAQQIAEDAEAQGLWTHWGRKVLEVRPPVAVSKGTAVSELLAERPHRHVLYGGDDRTDLDAFAALEGLHEQGRIETAVRVAVLSPEGPAELAERGDIAVEGPPGYLALLEGLAA